MGKPARPAVREPWRRPRRSRRTRAFFNRRQVLSGGASLPASIGADSSQPGARADTATPARAGRTASLKYTRNTKYSVDAKPNSYEDITSYNNFYELGTDKADPKANAATLHPRPWNVDGRRRVPRSRAPSTIDEHHQAASDGRAHLPLPLRRSLVDGRAVDGLSARRPDQALQADLEGEVRRS